MGRWCHHGWIWWDCMRGMVVDGWEKWRDRLNEPGVGGGVHSLHLPLPPTSAKTLFLRRRCNLDLGAGFGGGRGGSLCVCVCV